MSLNSVFFSGVTFYTLPLPVFEANWPCDVLFVALKLKHCVVQCACALKNQQSLGDPVSLAKAFRSVILSTIVQKYFTY